MQLLEKNNTYRGRLFDYKSPKNNLENSTEKAINLINGLQKTRTLLRYIMKCFIIIIPLFFIPSCYAQEKEEEGICIQMIDNNKDIYHKKNNSVRKKMKDCALLELIDRGATLKLKSNTHRRTLSMNVNNNENYSDEYAEEWLAKQDLSFKRTSNYDFEKIESGKWKVKVKGIIKDIETEDISDDDFNDYGNNNTDLYKDKKNTILRKSFNRVIIQNSSLSNPSRLKVWGYKERKTIVGKKRIKKLKGLLTVKKIQDDDKIIDAKILKGFWKIDSEDEVTEEHFRYSRSGLELGYSYQSLYDTAKFDVLGFSYFFQSLKSKLGFALGCDIINYSSPNISNNSELVGTPILFPNLKFDYSIGLIPDLLFLKPNLSIGYLLISDSPPKNLKIDENDWKIFEIYKNTRVMIRPALYLSLRFKSIDFSGGFSFVLNNDSINNFSDIENSLFPSFSIMFNFRRN